MKKKPFTLPFVLPVVAFALTILCGAILLWWDKSAIGTPVPFIDALFMSTSSVCVTGLATIDPSLSFNRFGQGVMLVLIQMGGLGITTYTTLIFYMWSKKISLTDRLAVGQVLLNDSSFHLGKFLQRIVLIILSLELCGATILYLWEPNTIGIFHSLFLAISAFCNAGFALWPDNLIGRQQDPVVNSVVMSLIVLGGLGFAVIDECLRLGREYLRNIRKQRQVSLVYLFRAKRSGIIRPVPKLSHNSRLIIKTTAFLIVAGALCILLPEFFANDEELASLPDLIWPALFQSVTSRTAGFCTMDIGKLSDISLLVIIFLMFIGGSPGSCAGGIKTTSFRVLLSFIRAQLTGKSQVVVQQKAVSNETISKVFVLLTFSILTLCLATFALVLSESGAQPHGKTPFQFLDLLFEAVSAFATVGLSTGITPQLTTTGKLIDCLLMFTGRLGPIWLITTLQQFHTDPAYKLPETDIPIG